MKRFLLKTGNGNDGCFPRCIIEFEEGESPFAFMDVVIANMFIPGHRARSHAYKNTMVDGELDYTIYATMHENFRGESNMGAAHTCVELHSDTEGYEDFFIYKVKEYLDHGAMMMFRKKNKQ